MKTLEPELITMDVNMPVMDGSTALKHIMIESPSPVLIMSNLGPASYATILTFLNLGAVDFMSKPVKHKNIVVQQQKIVDRVHVAAKAKVKRFKRFRRPPLSPEQFAKVRTDKTCETFVVVNSGVGGYLEMVNVVTAMPKDADACPSVAAVHSTAFRSDTGFLSFKAKPVRCPTDDRDGTTSAGTQLYRNKWDRFANHCKYQSCRIESH